jgi:succinate-acetate transporter protein
MEGGKMNDVVIEKNRDRLERETWTRAGPVVARIPDEEILALEERAMATVGDPSPMGLWAFATGIWIVGTIFGGAIKAAPETVAAAQAAVSTALPGGHLVPVAGALYDPFTAVVPVLLIFAGVAQFIAGLFAFRRASPLLGTVFCCFGAFGVTIATGFLLQASGALPVPISGSAQVLLGFLLESFAFISLALMVAALGVNMALVGMLFCFGIGCGLAGIPDLAAVQGGGWVVIGNIGGWFMVASALFAYYLGMALVVNSSWKRAALPIGGKAC